MPLMRFNQKELANVACKPSEHFEKEGILLLKEKEGLLRKSEGYSERLFRLRGNLLFYFKSKEKISEAAGVIVLEHCQVYVDPSKRNGFILDFDEGDEQKYELAANCKQDLIDWMERIKNAAYERLRQKLLYLRREIIKMTGQDPLPDHHSSVEVVATSNRMSSIFSAPPVVESTNDENGAPLMEMCIACSLSENFLESKPSTFVKIFTMTPPEISWTRHSQTEICEESYEPYFLKTTVLQQKLKLVTRIKLVLYEVKNRSKNDVISLGQAMCTIKEIQEAEGWRTSQTLTNLDSSCSVGTISLQGWKRNQRQRQSSVEFSGIHGQDDLISNHPRTYICQVVERSFHFPTKNGDDMKFQELMGETLLSFRIPQQLLNLFINEEKEAVVELHNLGNLHLHWEGIKQQLQNNHFDIVRQYSNCLAELSQYEGRNFKKSAEKADKELEFISTNLHVQRIRVVEKNGEDFSYDTVTVGAPAAHSFKFKHGGLKRLLGTAEETSRRMTLNPEDSEKIIAGTKARNMKCVLKEAKASLDVIFDEIISDNVDRDEIHDRASQISKMIADLLELESSSFIKVSQDTLRKARTSGPVSRQGSLKHALPFELQDHQKLQWEWTGNEFKPVSSTTGKVGGVDVTEALSNFMLAIKEALASQTTENVQEVISSSLNGLRKAVKSYFKKLEVTMRFVLMREEGGSVHLKDIRYRRDVVFSQTLTPIIIGFVIKLSQLLHNKNFMEQLAKVGLLMHIESLLTPYGDEMGMFEDMIIGVQDLKKVKFKITRDDSDDSFPIIKGNRSDIMVSIPLRSSQFKFVPDELNDEQSIKIHPVLFNVGVNEQATIAERFGDMSIQDVVNTESMNSLDHYYQKFINRFPNCCATKSEAGSSLTSLMSQLQTVIQNRKSKNVDIFLLSEEITWRMNGVRITSCKSAKDRSGMAVTLETARILEREHNMKEEVFSKILDTMRSHGTRLINSYKNTGYYKYAFNSLQVKAYPHEYRAPEGTYGKYVQT